MLVLPAKLTHDEAPACIHMLRQGLRAEPERPSVVDASALTHSIPRRWRCCSSAGARPWPGRGFAVKGLPPRLRELASLYGVAGFCRRA